MNWLSQMIHFLGGITFLCRDIFLEIKTKPFYFDILVRQIFEIGWKSIPIVSVLGACAGMILTMQFGFTLEKFGAKMYSPKILSLSIFREFGPIFTCLILTGRVGAGMTAQIGSMRVTQQVDALIALGTSPIKKIVIPYFLGGLIAIPLLCLWSCMVTIIFGVLIGYAELNLDPYFFLHKVFKTVFLRDFLSGYIKTYFFAIFITLTACYFGLRVQKGTYEVGEATTKTVVFSSILIIIADYILTKIFWIITGVH